MAAHFHLSVLTPTQSLLEEEVESVVLPGSEGYLGILAHHAPLITALKPGRMTVRRLGGETDEYALSGGFLEVSQNRAIVLADAVESASSVDLSRAQRALERARNRLRDRAGCDVERAEAALRRAQNRVQISADQAGAAADRR